MHLLSPGVRPRNLRTGSASAASDQPYVDARRRLGWDSRADNLDAALREHPQTLHDNLREPRVEVGLGLVPEENPALTEGAVGEQMNDRRDLAQALGHQVGLKMGTLVGAQVEPWSLQPYPPVKLPFEAFHHLLQLHRSPPTQRRRTERDGRVKVSLVEGEFARGVGGDEPLVHRQNLAGRQKERRDVDVRLSVGRPAGEGEVGDGRVTTSGDRDFHRLAVVELHAQAPFRCAGGTADQSAHLAVVGSKDAGKLLAQ